MQNANWDLHAKKPKYKTQLANVFWLNYSQTFPQCARVPLFEESPKYNDKEENKYWFNHIRGIYSNVDTFECMMINHVVYSTDERTTKHQDSVEGVIRDRLFYDTKSDTNWECIRNTYGG